jgi:hypothetical protein
MAYSKDKNGRIQKGTPLAPTQQQGTFTRVQIVDSSLLKILLKAAA